jgi:uncharacterized membrane protein YdbT with pleckstrin-like domain
MSDVQILHPSKLYLTKLYLNAVFGSLVITIVLSMLAAQIMPTAICGVSTFIVIFIAVQGVVAFVTRIYFNSIRYEIHPDEVVVHSGILTRTVKHVPFRTVTNITTTRDLLDQIIGIGSLSIQTAGSGSAVPEEKLVGIVELQELYSYVAQELRRFRSSMSPTQADNDEAEASGDVMFAILEELKAIRRLLQQR